MSLKSKFAGIVALLVLWSFNTAADANELLLVHGHFFTGNPRAPWASAMAVQGSRIAALGSDAQILKRRRGHTEVIDLEGQTVLPGFIDSHMHLLYGAFALHGLNL